jgi:hypothetical protein
VLWFGYSKLSDNGLVSIQGLTNLETLDLSGTPVTDAGLQRLAGFRNLVSLFVKKTNVTEAGVKKLAAARPRCKIEWDGGMIESRAAMGPDPQPAAEPSFMPLFNGKDLSGWQGDLRIWAVENAAIIAHGDRNPANGWKGNTFLVHQANYADFELRLQFKLSNHGNSGVQFRSVLKDDGIVLGYQAEIGCDRDGKDLTGNLYEEGTGRNFLATLDDEQRSRFETKYRTGDWNDLFIRCVGDHVVIQINGFKSVDMHDRQGRRSGFFALQSHGGIKPVIEFRKIEIKELRPLVDARPAEEDGVVPLFKGKLDPFQPKSIWFTDEPRRVLTVTQRKGAIFQARFEVGPSITRMITGTVKDGKVDWFAKDVRAIRGKVGDDNHGTVTSDDLGDKIDFVWGLHGKQKGQYTLRLRK